MAFDAEQKGIMDQSALAVVATDVVMGAGSVWLSTERFGLNSAMSSGDRIAFALKWDLLAFLWLAGCVRAVASGRFHEPAARKVGAYGEPTPALAIRVAMLQNSLEQTALILGSTLVLATALRGQELVFIHLSVWLFLAGRVAFTLAYPKGAAARAFGMALTAAPISAGYGYAAAWIIQER